MIDSCITHVGLNGYRKRTRHNWEALRPEIAELLTKEWGLYKLAKRYAMTPSGMAAVLRRLNMRTKHQIKAAEVAAEVARRLAASEKAGSLGVEEEQ